MRILAMDAYTKHAIACNQNENNAQRLAQRLSREIGIPLTLALAAVTANSAAKERHNG